MIRDLDRAGGMPDASFDVAIVGTGAAGIALALTLREQGLRVLMLEAGGSGFEQQAQNLYAAENGGLPYEGATQGRFRQFGGSTTQWGGQILETPDHVFAPRPWVAGSGWPFGKDVLEPYYARSIKLLGLTGAIERAGELWTRLGTEPPGLEPELRSHISRWCPVTNFTRLFAGALAGDDKLTVVLHASVTSIQLGSEGEIRALRCRNLKGAELKVAATSFVFCPGGIETSRMLLQPTEDGSSGPWTLSGWVGRHYQDHISGFVATIEGCAPDRAGALFDYLAADGHRYHPKLELAPAMQRSLETLDCCATVVSTTRGRDDLAHAFETFRMLKTRRSEVGLARGLHFLANFHRLAWHRLPFGRRASPWSDRSGRIMRLNVHSEQEPLSAGRISLTSSRDALGCRKARVEWRAGSQEVHTIRRFVEVAGRVFEQAGLGRVVPDAGIMEDEDAVVAAYGENSHHIGGARMATRAADGVVDTDLRLFGTSNGYVCGSAVFPSAGYPNPTHTILALAIRLGDHLAGKRASAPRSG